MSIKLATLNRRRNYLLSGDHHGSYLVTLLLLYVVRVDIQAYWNPEMQALHSKERMLQMLSCRKAEQGYKKKKLERSVSEPSPDAITAPVEMDCDPTEGNLLFFKIINLNL